MINCLDDSLYKNENEVFNYSGKEIEYNFSLDPNIYDKLDEIKIFNEFKKVLDINESYYDSEEINYEELYFIDKNKMIDINKNILKINDTSSKTNPLKIKVEINKRGRKIKSSNEKGNHNKKSFDNLLKRIKHSLLKGLKILINIKIKEIYKDYKDNKDDKGDKKLLTLDQTETNNSSIEFNKIFINKSIKEIFSGKLTTKYKSKKDTLEIHNEDLINELLSGKDIEKRNIFESIFNLKFIDVVNYVIGVRNDLTQLYGLKLTDNLLEEISIDEEYSEILYDTMRNLEKILNSKKSRNRSKK
jgi:hypothetical protein